MWQLIIESPTRAARAQSGRRLAGRAEPFLDFDPILPGWPAAEAPGWLEDLVEPCDALEGDAADAVKEDAPV